MSSVATADIIVRPPDGSAVSGNNVQGSRTGLMVVAMQRSADDFATGDILESVAVYSVKWFLYSVLRA